MREFYTMKTYGYKVHLLHVVCFTCLRAKPALACYLFYERI